ncbi:hypothetical protein BBG19_0165 [Francisella sp. MA067296]|nr:MULTISPECIES: hypothetical protein [Francisella]APC90903.1 hypothetical protein BBG19_0165 [Francisella sp. MA067296]
MKKSIVMLIFWFGACFANDELKFNIKLHNNTQEGNFYMLKKPRFISDNISCPQQGSWMQTKHKGSYLFWTEKQQLQKLFTANVPLISTYSPDSFELLWPALSLHTRVDDTSLYFVVQQKIDRKLTNSENDNVTVKYHSLIADGIKTGVGKSNNKVLKGKFNLRDSKGSSLIGGYRDMVVLAYDNLWSGPENDAILREMLTTNTSKDNSVIISEFIVSDDNQNAAFIDKINLGVKKIVTVHVLLNEKDFDKFIQEIYNQAYSDEIDDGFQLVEVSPSVIIDDRFLEKYVVNQGAIQAVRGGLELYEKEIINLKEEVVKNIAVSLSISDIDETNSLLESVQANEELNQSEVIQLKNALETANADLEKLKAQLDDANKRSKELEDKLANSEQQAKDFKGQLDNLQQLQLETKKEQERLAKAVRGRQQKLDKAKEQIEEYKHQLAKLQQQPKKEQERLLKLFQDKSYNLNKANDEIESYKHQLAKSKEKKEQAEKVIDDLQAKLTEAKKQIEEYRLQLAKFQEETKQPKELDDNKVI